MTIGERIRYYRKKCGLTQTHLAELAGIHPVTIRKYETNKMQPQLSRIIKIAAILNVNPNILIGIENTKRNCHTTIGEKIRYYRKKCGLTQKNLGTALGYPENSAPIRIAQYESNQRIPKKGTILKMASALHISSDDLICYKIEEYFMGSLFSLINSGKISIEGQRNSNDALDQSTISFKIKDPIMIEDICNFEKANYLRQKALKQKDTYYRH